MATGTSMSHEAVNSICNKLEISPSKSQGSSPVYGKGGGKRKSAKAEKPSGRTNKY